MIIRTSDVAPHSLRWNVVFPHPRLHPDPEGYRGRQENIINLISTEVKDDKWRINC